jgi:hypothetical protein
LRLANCGRHGWTDDPHEKPRICRGRKPVNSARAITMVVGILCLAVGALLGWVGALQMPHGHGDAAGVLDAVRAEKAAAARAAVTAEGWARVGNGAYTLAKLENDHAQQAQKQAREFAARAENAAKRAAASAARIDKDRSAPHALATSPAAVRATPTAVARVAPTATPRVAPTAVARVSPAPRPKRRIAAAKAPVRASDESCRRAAIYERTAANASLSRQAAYNASVSGIAVNAHCSEPERSLIEAYLLAQRASAESALKIGDWKSDLVRSNRVLAQCIRHPERYGAIGRNCRQRLTKNERLQTAARPQS